SESVGSVTDLNPLVQVNAIPAADLLLAALQHSFIPANDGVAVAALDSTGVPALPDFSGRDGNNRNYNVFGSVVVPVGTLPAARSWEHAASGDYMDVFGAGCGDACRSGLR